MIEHESSIRDTSAGGHPDELLPWYANGTLEGEDRARVESHLAGCDRCRAEVEGLRELRAALKRGEAAEGPGELGRRRLRRTVAQERRRVRPRSLWRPALAAAAALVIAVETGLLVREATGPETYRPLQGAGPAEAVLQVRFAPEATEAQIRALLNEVGAYLVGGPGALGVYRLALEERGPDAVERAASRLRRREAIVREVRRQ